MKTLDEAIAVIAPELKQPVDGAELLELQDTKDFIDRFEKRREIHNDLVACEHLKELIRVVAELYLDSAINLESALFTMFSNGLFVGIEMEKHES